MVWKMGVRFPGSNANTCKNSEKKLIALTQRTEHLYIFTSGNAKFNPTFTLCQLSEVQNLPRYPEGKDNQIKPGSEKESAFGRASAS